MLPNSIPDNFLLLGKFSELWRRVGYLPSNSNIFFEFCVLPKHSLISPVPSRLYSETVNFIILRCFVLRLQPTQTYPVLKTHAEWCTQQVNASAGFHIKYILHVRALVSRPFLLITIRCLHVTSIFAKRPLQRYPKTTTSFSYMSTGWVEIPAALRFFDWSSSFSVLTHRKRWRTHLQLMGNIGHCWVTIA